MQARSAFREKASRLLVGVGKSLQKAELRKILWAQRKAVRSVKLQDLQVLIDRNVSLMRVLPDDADSFLKDLPSIDIDVLIEVLEEVHPAMGELMGSEAGRRWLKDQQAMIRGL